MAAPTMYRVESNRERCLVRGGGVGAAAVSPEPMAR